MACGKNYNVQYLEGKQHQCNTRWCQKCKEYVKKEANHQHYMAPIRSPRKRKADKTDNKGEHNKKIKKNKPQSYIYFDLETRQDRVARENQWAPDYVHNVICAIGHKVCEGCWEKELTEDCEDCGPDRKGVFLGEDALEQFCQWLYSSSHRAGTLVFAHYGQGFDYQFLLRYAFNNLRHMPKNPVHRGTKIMAFEVEGGPKFRDSFNFLPMALAAMPKTFSFPEKKKDSGLSSSGQNRDWTMSASGQPEKNTVPNSWLKKNKRTLKNGLCSRGENSLG